MSCSSKTCSLLETNKIALIHRAATKALAAGKDLSASRRALGSRYNGCSTRNALPRQTKAIYPKVSLKGYSPIYPLGRFARGSPWRFPPGVVCPASRTREFDKSCSINIFEARGLKNYDNSSRTRTSQSRAV